MKRFVDTEIWEKDWFMNLKSYEKLSVLYVLTKCDNVGVWNPNTKLADILIGKKINWESLAERCSKNIEVLPNGKWWVKDFVDFQWGELKETSPPHRSFIKLLKKHNLYQRVLKGYIYPTDSPKEKEKDKDKDKETDKEVIRLFKYYKSEANLNGSFPTLTQMGFLRNALNYQDLESWKPYCDEMNRQVREGILLKPIPMKFFFEDRFMEFEPKESSTKRLAREMGLE